MTDDRPLRILVIVNGAWDPRLGAVRVWIELAAEWTKAGNFVEKFCLTDAFPKATSSSALASFRLLLFPFRAARFVRNNADRFDVIDAHIGALPFSKQSLRWKGLLVARSVGLYQLYENFEKAAAKRWPPPDKGKLSGRIFYRFFKKRVRAASEASVKYCDLLNLPNLDELSCVRDEMQLATAAVVQPYGLAPARHQALGSVANSVESRWRAKKICFLGMWSARKGARDWGQIIQQIRARVPEARFLFLGTMVENRLVLEDLNLGVPDFLELVPQFAPDDLPKLLADCTVGAFPSYVEGFGLAVIEQLAAGLPTVAYDAPGPRDVLGDALPELLISTGDIPRFSEAVVAVLQREFESYQDLCRRSANVAERFSWPRIARDTLAEYRVRLPERHD
jgi:glycosyltransferase involved in cell wall biosynthesis